ncbi:hypothetical protein OQA88_10014 [Cercophora sp. LCS_1]
MSREQAVTKALENLERRTPEVVFNKEKWYDWVRKEQGVDEENREMEQKKMLKMEAALFRRHWKGVETRLKATREKEEEKRREAYPEEDVYQDDRDKSIDLIKHFLWMGIQPKKIPEPEPQPEPEEAPEADTEADAAAAAEPAAPLKKRRRGKRKGQPQKPPPTPKDSQSAKNGSSVQDKTAQLQPDLGDVESKDEVMKRLREGARKDYSHVQGAIMVGTAQVPHELCERTAPVSEDQGRHKGTGLYCDLLSAESRRMVGTGNFTFRELKKEPKDQKMNIRVCGKSIWNHAS